MSLALDLDLNTSVLLKRIIVLVSNMASETSLSNPQPDELEGWIWSQFQDGELQDSAKFMEHELTGHEASLLNGDVAEIEPSSTVQTPSNPNSVPFLAEAQRLRTTLCPNEQLLRKLVARVQTLEQK